MGCCLLAIIGALWPRLALLGVWILRPDIPGKEFPNTLYPVLGFIFLPTTTLAYELVKHFNGGVIDGVGLVILVLALLHDIGHVGAGMRRRRAVK